MWHARQKVGDLPDRPGHWVFSRGRSWWGSFSLCNDSPPENEGRSVTSLRCRDKPPPQHTDETRLVKVQPHDDVRLFCQLVCRLQEVHMTDVWRKSQKKRTLVISEFWDSLRTVGSIVVEGYGRGRRPLPRRWWCPRAEALGLRRTGWSSVRSAGTGTPPSRDCDPSGVPSDSKATADGFCFTPKCASQEKKLLAPHLQIYTVIQSSFTPTFPKLSVCCW